MTVEIGPFQRLAVTFAPQGGTLVEWFLEPSFRDSLPHTFQLQTAMAPQPDEEDWVDVGTPVVDGTYAVDDEQRLYGNTVDVHYRVLLDTPSGSYVSPVVNGLSVRDFRDWRATSKLILLERKRTKYYTGVEGWLLKERRYGPLCSSCLDPMTEQPTNVECSECFGVRFQGGYHPPIPDVWIDLSVHQSREMQDDKARGTVRDERRMARFVGPPHVASRDVFVEKGTGRRWFIETMRVDAEWRGIVQVRHCEMRLAPFSDPIYKFPVD